MFLVLRISYKSVESWFPNPQCVFCLESPCFLSPCSACVIQTSDREISEQAHCAVPASSDITDVLPHSASLCVWTAPDWITWVGWRQEWWGCEIHQYWCMFCWAHALSAATTINENYTDKLWDRIVSTESLWQQNSVEVYGHWMSWEEGQSVIGGEKDLLHTEVSEINYRSS